jgi:hypothetical protein
MYSPESSDSSADAAYPFLLLLDVLVVVVIILVGFVDFDFDFLLLLFVDGVASTVVVGEAMGDDTNCKLEIAFSTFVTFPFISSVLISGITVSNCG